MTQQPSQLKEKRARVVRFAKAKWRNGIKPWKPLLVFSFSSKYTPCHFAIAKWLSSAKGWRGTIRLPNSVISVFIKAKIVIRVESSVETSRFLAELFALGIPIGSLWPVRKERQCSSWDTCHFLILAGFTCVRFLPDFVEPSSSRVHSAEGKEQCGDRRRRLT